MIYLFEQIILSAISKRVDFDKNDFAITNFISVTKDKPFIAFNQDTLNNLKAKYGFDISNVSILGKGNGFGNLWSARKFRRIQED